MSTNSTELFEYGLQQEGLSKEAYEICTRCNPGQIDHAIDVDPQVLLDAKKFEVVMVLPDDSGSIPQYVDDKGNHSGPDSIVNGHNNLIGSFQGATQIYRDGVLVLTWPLNADLPLKPFTLLDANPELLQNGNNYRADGGTPLYDKAALLLASALALKLRVKKEAKAECGGSILIISDGEDMHSQAFKANDVAVLVKELMGSDPAKPKMIISFMGLKGNTVTKVDFHDIAHQMGIPDKYILETSMEPSDLRHVFEKFGQASLNAMQNR